MGRPSHHPIRICPFPRKASHLQATAIGTCADQSRVQCSVPLVCIGPHGFPSASSVHLPRSYLINSPNSMTTSRPSTPVMKECDSAAALSTQCNPSAGTIVTTTWPRTQLILETPERKRLRYALQNGGIYTTPPKRPVIASPKTPVTPKRRPRNVPGENLFDDCPSPLRRFRISQSTTPLAEKYVNAIAGTEYRFKDGETLSITPSKEVKDIADSPKSSTVTTIQTHDFLQTCSPEVLMTSLDDSGISSMDHDSTLDSSIWCSSTFDESAYFSADMLDDSFDNYQTYNTETENSMDCDSWAANPPGNDVPSNDSPVPAPTPVFTETPVGPPYDDNVEVQPCTSEKPCSSAFVTEPEATVLDDPRNPISSRASSTTESTPSSSISKTRVNQKDVADEIHFLLDQYDDVPFNEDFVDNVDMTEFRKLKLMSSTTSSWYKTVLGRSREQIEVTREAHRYLNQVKRVKSRK